jgi:ADP-ribose pyrophosphatase
MNPPKLECWETLESRDLVVAKPWIELAVQKVRLPDGREIENYYRLKMSDYAAIFAETDDGLVIMERQYKHGVGRVNLVLPGGAIEPGEAPLAAAQRELLEETGYVADSWQCLGCFITNANYGGSKAHVFVAKNARLVAQPNSGDLEEIEIVLMKREEVAAAICNGEIVVLGAVAAIALALNSAFIPEQNSPEQNKSKPDKTEIE